MKKSFYTAAVFLGVLAGPFWYFGKILPSTDLDASSGTISAVSDSKCRGIGCYVINLDRSTGRMKAMSGLLTQLNLPFFRICAIDGTAQPEVIQNPHYVNIQGYVHLLKGRHPGKGEIGCYISHVKALKAFLESSYEFGLICEDDISFSPALFQKILFLLTQQKTLWDLCSFELSVKKPAAPLPIASLGNHALCLYQKQAFGAGAYLINRAAARSLVEKAFPMQVPWDVYYLRFWELKGQNGRMLHFTGVEPRLVHQTYGDSEIETTDQRYLKRHQGDYWSWVRFKGRLFLLCTDVLHWVWTRWQYMTLKISVSTTKIQKEYLITSRHHSSINIQNRPRNPTGLIRK